MSYDPSNRIEKDFKRGFNLTIGYFNRIEENVRVGNDVEIRNYVELRKGTIIGDECYIDSRVSTSGAPNCVIGNRVTIRYASIIARNVVIEDDVFISPQVGFINIPFTDKEKKTTIIRKGVKIGFAATIHAGVEIAEGAIIGAKANVTKDILKAGVYVGNPARLLIPRNKKIKIGKNVVIEPGTTIGAQPTLFMDKGKPIIPEFGVKINDGTWIGSDTRVMLGSIRDTYIGKDVMISQFCNVGHDSIIGDKARIMAGVIMGGHAEIGKYTVVGMGAIIRNRVKVGACSFIGQGSNVVKDIPDNVIAYGNPCVVKGKRFQTMPYLIRRYLT